MPASRHSGQRRGLELSAVTAIAPVLAVIPVWLLALVPVWWVFNRWWDVSFLVVALGHLGAAILLFLRPVQVVVLGRLLGARHPRGDEVAILDGAWRSVLQASGLPRHRYVVMVVPSSEVNAYACGGHLVVVSTFAIESLPRDELCGVLAHELSHHLGLHTVALTIGQWLSVPVWLLARLGFTLHNIAVAATNSFARDSTTFTTIGRLVSGLLTVVSWVLLSGLWLSNAIANVVGRRSEFEADQRALHLGFGAPLASALRRVADRPPYRSLPWFERLSITHPPARVRVARLDSALRAPSARQAMHRRS
jgi:Zn-dependent protease with chaperone function